MFLRLWLLCVLFFWDLGLLDLDLFLWLFLGLLLDLSDLCDLSLLFVGVLLGLLGFSFEILGSSLLDWLFFLWLLGGIFFVLRIFGSFGSFS
jgi:hypothetical protein